MFPRDNRLTVLEPRMAAQPLQLGQCKTKFSNIISLSRLKSDWVEIPSGMDHSLAMGSVTSWDTTSWGDRTFGEAWSETTRTFSRFNCHRLVTRLKKHFFQPVLLGTSPKIMPSQLNFLIWRPCDRCINHNTNCPSELFRYCKILAITVLFCALHYFAWWDFGPWLVALLQYKTQNHTRGVMLLKGLFHKCKDYFLI